MREGAIACIVVQIKGCEKGADVEVSLAQALAPLESFLPWKARSGALLYLVDHVLSSCCIVVLHLCAGALGCIVVLHHCAVSLCYVIAMHHCAELLSCITVPQSGPGRKHEKGKEGERPETKFTVRGMLQW